MVPGRSAPVFYESCLDSTNRLLKEMAAAGAENGAVLIAGRQTGGRGRLGRGFVSPEGGLYLSLLLRPEGPPERAASLSALAAVAVCRAVRAAAGVEAAVKWPNDVLLHGKKLCGILAESAVEAGKVRVVLGIGVNANLRREDFPEELRETACSLLTETGRPVDLDALAGELIRTLDTLTAAWAADAGAFLEEYRRLCVTPGREVLVLRGGAGRRALALAVNDGGSLRVRWPDGREEDICSGEVSVRGLLGYAE